LSFFLGALLKPPGYFDIDGGFLCGWGYAEGGDGMKWTSWQYFLLQKPIKDARRFLEKSLHIGRLTQVQTHCEESVVEESVVFFEGAYDDFGGGFKEVLPIRKIYYNWRNRLNESESITESIPEFEEHFIAAKGDISSNVWKIMGSGAPMSIDDVTVFPANDLLAISGDGLTVVVRGLKSRHETKSNGELVMWKYLLPSSPYRTSNGGFPGWFVINLQASDGSNALIINGVDQRYDTFSKIELDFSGNKMVLIPGGSTNTYNLLLAPIVPELKDTYRITVLATMTQNSSECSESVWWEMLKYTGGLWQGTGLEVSEIVELANLMIDASRNGYTKHGADETNNQIHIRFMRSNHPDRKNTIATLRNKQVAIFRKIGMSLYDLSENIMDYNIFCNDLSDVYLDYSTLQFTAIEDIYNIHQNQNVNVYGLRSSDIFKQTNKGYKLIFFAPYYLKVWINGSSKIESYIFYNLNELKQKLDQTQNEDFKISYNYVPPNLETEVGHITIYSDTFYILKARFFNSKNEETNIIVINSIQLELRISPKDYHWIGTGTLINETQFKLIRRHPDILDNLTWDLFVPNCIGVLNTSVSKIFSLFTISDQRGVKFTVDSSFSMIPSNSQQIWKLFRLSGGTWGRISADESYEYTWFDISGIIIIEGTATLNNDQLEIFSRTYTYNEQTQKYQNGNYWILVYSVENSKGALVGYDENKFQIKFTSIVNT
jgi:hypothetical protein